MNSPLRTHDLTKTFRRVVAVAGVNLEVPEGGIYALVGPNGAGKTTIIKVMMNIVRATSGRAEVLGGDSSRLSGRAFEKIGYVSENQGLPEWMRVGAFLTYLRPFYATWDRDLEAQLVRQMELPLDRKLKELSRGMRMKVALASSLAYHPKLIVLDEPFSGLDPLVRDQLMEGMLERASEATIFISSHDLAEVETFASHVGYLEEGQLRFSEEMSVLTQRFREVEVVLDGPAVLPPQMPGTWLMPAASSAVVRFVETSFEEEQTRARIAGVFGNVRAVTVTPMSLRAIFIAMAKAGKQAPGERA